MRPQERRSLMAKTKYKPIYKKKLLDYFLKFIDLRDDPDLSDGANRHGMISLVISDEGAEKQTKPATGYPTLTKFAIKIGVSPRTISNWRREFPDFDEACEFAEAIFDDVIDERALTGTVDGRVAMKIRELKQNSRNNDNVSGATKVIFEIREDEGSKRIDIKEWDGEVNEECDY
jgi:hypothetical protein